MQGDEVNLLGLLCRNRKRLQITQLVQTVKDPLEKALFEQFKLAYQAGKGSKKLVPTLIPIDRVKS